MNSRIKYKLTIKVPGTKLLADYLFDTKEEIESFVNLNEIRPFAIKAVFHKYKLADDVQKNENNSLLLT